MNPDSETEIEEQSGVVHRRIQSKTTPNARLIDILALIQKLDSQPVRLFANSIRLRNPSETPDKAGQNETWDFDAQWDYFVTEQ